MYLPSTGDADAHPRLTTCNASGIAIRAHHPYIPTSAHTCNRPHTRRHIPHIYTYARIGRGTRADICRQAYHVFNRGLAAGLPVDRPAPTPQQPLAGCTTHAPAYARAHALRVSAGRKLPHHQTPALAPKLQSSLIMLGPRKAAVRRPQHGYRVQDIKYKEGLR